MDSPASFRLSLRPPFLASCVRFSQIPSASRMRNSRPTRQTDRQRERWRRRLRHGRCRLPPLLFFLLPPSHPVPSSPSVMFDASERNSLLPPLSSSPSSSSSFWRDRMTRLRVVVVASKQQLRRRCPSSSVRPLARCQTQLKLLPPPPPPPPTLLLAQLPSSFETNFNAA